MICHRGGKVEPCNASRDGGRDSSFVQLLAHEVWPWVDVVSQAFLRFANVQSPDIMKTLFAVLLIAASNCVLANETPTPPPVRSEQKATPDAAAKKVTNKNVGRATAKPFLTGERPRNAFEVPLLRDARSLPSLTAPRSDG